MSETFVQVAPDSTGKKIATSELSNGADTVEIQHTVIADDSTYAARAKVSNAVPGATDYGLVVRQAVPAQSNYHAVSAATTNAANVKASAGTVVGYDIFNNGAYPVYVKLHNTAGTPTAGSGVVRTIGVQAGTRAVSPPGLSFALGTGIGISIVKGIADADATAVAASDCVVDLSYV
jgi:hypothetical protein